MYSIADKAPPAKALRVSAAKAKADKIEQIERQNDRAIAQWENQCKRLDWESRQNK